MPTKLNPPNYHDDSQPFHPEERLVGVPEVAEWLGMTKDWVRERFSVPAYGGIKPIKVGNKSKWPTWAVRAWIAARERDAQS